ncbi:Peptidyl-tRNA hydrolase [Geodia barretti]|uniref:Peptidyl-tRNA hydrolase n=1 Tax=Geodia barretti TaxID=519541 RepID=A0AA35TMM9_GEOBA|nr:Peptidyl-tRNA hydrolase [Geodia barretti]
MEDTQQRNAPLIVVGLGNPGPRYRDTRHNVGFGCVDLLAERWGIAVKTGGGLPFWGKGIGDGTAVVLAKPRTFMNLSGESVGYLLARFGGKAADLVIVYDEMALPLGRIRLRAPRLGRRTQRIKDIIRTVHTVDSPPFGASASAGRACRAASITFWGGFRTRNSPR